MGKNEILLFATTCVKLEDIMLSEISHTKKHKLPYDFTFMGKLKSKTIVKTK